MVQLAGRVGRRRRSSTRTGNVTLGEPADRRPRVMREARRPRRRADPAMSNNKEDQARLGVRVRRARPSGQLPVRLPERGRETRRSSREHRLGALPARRRRTSRATSPLGGINLGVGAYSKNPDLAFEAAECLRSPTTSSIAAREGRPAADDRGALRRPKIKKAYPVRRPAAASRSTTASPRPVTPAYSDISLAIQKTLPPAGRHRARDVDRGR